MGFLSVKSSSVVYKCSLLLDEAARLVMNFRRLVAATLCVYHKGGL